ncbi:lectin c-type domain-containing protein [Ditylenchus destructor]|nr:lectin c-type domain-containing protein [Ditylenchus destructor]
MLATFLTIILLYCNATPVLSDCPKAQQWMNKTISPGGPLVCAKLYADDKCAGFPLPFGINSSSSDLGTASSSLIDFQVNSVTALVRPGCNMYLWEGANFTGDHHSSASYIWNVGQKHYRSAVCNCSIEDPELLQCEMREKWELLKACNFYTSDTGGLCPVSLKQSYIEDESGVAKKISLTKSLNRIFVEKIAQSFEEERMSEFIDLNNIGDFAKQTVSVEARSWINYLQRSYVCGKYHLFTPETVRKHVLEYYGLDQTGTKNGKWIYNPHSNSYFWFSLHTANKTEARAKCEELGGHLATIDTIELRRWVEPFLASAYAGDWWIGLSFSGKILRGSVLKVCHYQLLWEYKLIGPLYLTETCKNDDRKCVSLSSDNKLGLFQWEMDYCELSKRYICEKENDF